ncbi:MAG TPA: SLC13 family permease [Sedimentisphaerales bacterium]|nr:SLC13 family permease [Sedimentisphaerales bacterium]
MAAVEFLGVLTAGTTDQTGPAIPLIILAVGIGIVIGMIVVLRVNAFLALIVAAMVVSLMSPGPVAERVSRVATAFGAIAGRIGIIIALAAIIGDCLIASGAADRVVRTFVRLLGQKRCEVSLMASGFVLSVPVFFDTVFYLLLPLARSMHRQTKKKYLLLILAMGAGASITHSMVPPTPGPLIIAETLGVNLGVMIAIGILCSIPTAVAVLFLVRWLAGRIDIPMRALGGGRSESDPSPDDKLPGLFMSILPIVLPVLLITMDTVVSSLAKGADANSTIRQAAGWTALLGNANLAMMLSAAVALHVLWHHRKPGREKLSKLIETSLMSAGVIILITSAGGAFGAMLKEAQIGPAIRDLSVGGATQLGGLKLLLMGFFVAFLIKFAQGSSTVSMMTTSAMMATLIPSADVLGYHPVYVACAIGWGAQCGNWMNDSGFWVFAKMGGLTEIETLKTWTVTVSSTAVIGLIFVVLFATLLPLT